MPSWFKREVEKRMDKNYGQLFYENWWPIAFPGVEMVDFDKLPSHLKYAYSKSGDNLFNMIMENVLENNE